MRNLIRIVKGADTVRLYHGTNAALAAEIASHGFQTAAGESAVIYMKMARHSRVYSSITVSMRKGRPSEVRSCTKS